MNNERKMELREMAIEEIENGKEIGGEIYPVSKSQALGGYKTSATQRIRYGKRHIEELRAERKAILENIKSIEEELKEKRELVKEINKIRREL